MVVQFFCKTCSVDSKPLKRFGTLSKIAPHVKVPNPHLDPLSVGGVSTSTAIDLLDGVVLRVRLRVVLSATYTMDMLSQICMLFSGLFMGMPGCRRTVFTYHVAQCTLVPQ